MGRGMAEVIVLEEFRQSAEPNATQTLVKVRRRKARDRDHEFNKPAFPSSRPGISGNLCDLFEQANAVAVRHYDGDPRVPRPVAEKCLELLAALSDYATPE